MAFAIQKTIFEKVFQQLKAGRGGNERFYD